MKERTHKGIMADLRAKWAKVKREAAERKRQIRAKSRASMGLIAVSEGRGRKVIMESDGK
jgi:hypothetical protein